MLTRSDIRALQASGLTPNQRNALGATLRARPFVIARLTRATYSNVSGGVVNLVQAVLDPGTFHVGDQFVVEVGGYGNNNTGANVSVGATFVFTSSSNSISIGATSVVPNTGANKFAWHSHINLALSIPNFSGQASRPAITNLAGASPAGGLSSLGPQPPAVANVSILGSGYTLTSDTSLFGVQAGGTLQAGAAGNDSMKAGYQDILFSTAQPLLITITLSDVSNINAPLTVDYGYIMAL